jgi:hypothetical protein
VAAAAQTTTSAPAVSVIEASPPSDPPPSPPFQGDFRDRCYPYVGEENKARAREGPGMMCWFTRCSVTGCEKKVCLEHG